MCITKIITLLLYQGRLQQKIELTKHEATKPIPYLWCRGKAYDVENHHSEATKQFYN